MAALRQEKAADGHHEARNDQSVERLAKKQYRRRRGDGGDEVDVSSRDGGSKMLRGHAPGDEACRRGNTLDQDRIDRSDNRGKKRQKVS